MRLLVITEYFIDNIAEDSVPARRLAESMASPDFNVPSMCLAISLLLLARERLPVIQPIFVDVDNRTNQSDA